MARKTHINFLTTTEANAALFRLSDLNLLIEAIEAQYTEEVAKLRKEADKAISPLLTQSALLKKSLEVFAKTYRSSLLPGGEKTVKLSGGSFGWRLTPFKVTTGRGGDSKALATVKALNLMAYVHIQESLDKEALLKDRPVIAGIKYTQKEKFFVNPKPAVDDPDASANAVTLEVTEK